MNYGLLLSNLSKHISLTTDEENLFISKLHSRALEKGAFLLREGDVFKYETFVVKGS